MDDCIVIVDDDSDEIELIASALTTLDNNVKCLAFTGVADAINHVKAMDQLPLGIILDLNMPQLSGIDFLKCMQEPLRNNSMHVVVQSCAEPNEKTLNEIRSLGGFFIVKPYKYSDYADKLKALLLKWRKTNP
jgi:DNA-binding NtrC family response regulator